MRVVVLDVDWWNELSDMPNPVCMKISSFHKQHKDTVTFAKDEFDLRLQYDKLYAVRENIRGGLPKCLDLLDERVNLIGNGMRFYSRYVEHLDDAIINGCRPDYSLYPLTTLNKQNQADYVQFYQDGHLIKIQDYHNSYNRAKETRVMDDGFWSYPEQSVNKCCRRLKNDRNIHFSGVVNLNDILESKIKTNWFFKLKIDYHNTNCKVELKTPKNFKDFDLFLQRYKQEIKTKKFYIETDIIYSEDFTSDDRIIFTDFFNYFKLIAEARQCGISLLVNAPPRLHSIYWYLFEDLQRWTHDAPETSFVEYMTYTNRRRFKYDVEACMNDEIRWRYDEIDRLVKLWKRFPDLMSAYGYVQWKERKYTEFDMNEYIRRKQCYKFF